MTLVEIIENWLKVNLPDFEIKSTYNSYSYTHRIIPKFLHKYNLRDESKFEWAVVEILDNYVRYVYLPNHNDNKLLASDPEFFNKLSEYCLYRAELIQNVLKTFPPSYPEFLLGS